MTHIPTIVIATVAGLTLPTVASAAPKPADSEATTKPSRVDVAKQRRYCVEGPVTGSRIATRVCKPLDDWLAEGFDPRARK